MYALASAFQSRRVVFICTEGVIPPFGNVVNIAGALRSGAKSNAVAIANHCVGELSNDVPRIRILLVVNDDSLLTAYDPP